jgi:hypothetical protein
MRSAAFYSDIKWLTKFSGADRKGKWLVCIEMIFWSTFGIGAERLPNRAFKSTEAGR